MATTIMNIQNDAEVQQIFEFNNNKKRNHEYFEEFQDDPSYREDLFEDFARWARKGKKNIWERVYASEYATRSLGWKQTKMSKSEMMRKISEVFDIEKSSSKLHYRLNDAEVKKFKPNVLIGYDSIQPKVDSDSKELAKMYIEFEKKKILDFQFSQCKNIDTSLLKPQAWFPAIGVEEDVKDKIAHLTSVVENISENGIKVGIQHNMDYAKFMKLFLMLSMAASAVLLIHRKKYFLSLLNGLGAAGVVFEGDVREAVNTFVTETENIQQDVDVDFSPLLKLFFVGLGVKRISDGKLKDFSALASGYQRIIAGSKDMFADVVRIVESIINYIRTKVFGLEKLKMIDKMADETQEWIDDVEIVSHAMDVGDFVIDSVNYDKILLLKSIGDRIFKESCKGGAEYSQIRSVITLYNKKIQDILSPFKKMSLDSSTIRAPPLAILLRGESGVGKSAVTIPLIDRVIIGLIDDEKTLARYLRNNMDFIYSRTYETKYWDGYNNQLVTVFDDFMQSIECLSDPDGEPMNLIRAMNPFPYQLHMAHLDDKGSKFFSSKIILATTNDYNLHSALLKKPEALKRRFEIQVDVVPKLKYCKDPENFTLRERRLRHDIGSFTLDVYEFHVFENNTPVECKSAMNFDEFSDFLIQAYQCKHSIGNAYVSDIANMRKNLVEKRIAEINANKLDVEKCVPQSGTYDEQIYRSIPDITNRESIIFMKKEIFGNIKIKETRPQIGDDDVFQDARSSYDCTLDYSYRFQSGSSPDCNCERNYMKLMDDELIPKIKELPGVMCKQFVMEIINDGKNCNCYTSNLGCKYVMDVQFGGKPKASAVVKDIFTRIVGKAKQIFKQYPLITGTVAVLALLKMAHSLYRMWTGNESLITQYGDNMGKGPNKVARPLSAFKAVVIAAKQDNNDDVCKPDVYSRMNTFAISTFGKSVYVAYLENAKHPWGFFTAIDGDIFMLNAHYYKSAIKRISEKGSLDVSLVPYKYVVLGDTLTSNFHVNMKNIVNMYPPTEEMLQNDVWLFRISNMRPHKNIIKRFVDEEELDNYNQTIPIAALFLREMEDGNNAMAANVTKARINRKPFKKTDWTISRHYSFPFTSENGDCGSLSVLVDPGYNNVKIIGIHSGLLMGENAIGTFVTRQMMERFVAETVKVNNTICCLPQGVDPDFTYDDNGILMVDSPHHYYRPTKSKLEKSPLYGLFGEAKREPALLKNKDNLNPYEIALNRYGTGNFHVDEKSLRAASDNYMSLILKTCTHNPVVFSKEEAVKGIECRPYVNGVCRKTSPGYPWNIDKESGKWAYFGRDQEYDLTSKDCVKLFKRVDEIIAAAKEGKRLEHYYIDALKDELRDVKKILSGKTRMISCCPLDLVICFKMYFGAFVEAFISGRGPNGSAVGVNPASTEWTSLAKLLLQVGKNIVAGDFTSFDATQATTTLMEPLRIINAWYGDSEENQMIRQILWMEVVNSMHLHGDKAVMFDHSLPSGNPLTTIINTMYVNIVARMAWIKCLGEDTSSIHEFNYHVCVIAFGDDHLFGISDEAIKYFNYNTIKLAMKSFGLIYTNEDKTESSVESKELNQCTFLKRGFRFENGEYAAPLDINVVKEMCYWYRNGPGVDDRIAENVKNTLRELSVHEPDVWDTISGKLFSHCRKHQIHVDIATQSEYQVLHKVHWAECSDLSEYLDDPSKINLCDVAVEQSGEYIDPVVDNNVGGKNIGTEEMNDKTVFLSDAPVRQYEPAPVVDVNSMLLSIPKISVQDDVRSFLSRPVRISSFSFATTNAANDQLFAQLVPTGVFYNSVTSLWYSKLAGFAGIRATAVFRFVVAVNRFAQGRLLIHYLPGPQDPDYERQHNKNLMTKTQQPRIEINVNRDTSAEIKMPYVSPATHYNLITTEGPWGRIFATCYSPLVGPVSPIDVSVFLHFEDIDLVLPTYGYPQMGDYRDNEAQGPLTRNLRLARKISSAFTEVPMLSSIATPATWFLSAVSNCAAALGLAVTNNATHFMRILDIPNAYSLTADGQRGAIPLSYSNENKVDTLPGFAGNDIDEMSLRYFAARSAFITSFTFSNTNVADDMLTNWLVYPRGHEFNVTTHSSPAILSGTVYTMPPVTFLSFLTSYWRGSLVYTFKFVKTEFHTGKIAICFFPQNIGAPSGASSSWTMRHIVDLKDTDEFRVTVPYAAVTPWIPSDRWTGQFVVYVVNPLNAPTSVSSNISVIVEIAGGSDFAVAGLRDAMPVPYTEAPAVAQSGLFTDDERIKSFTIGDTKVPTKDLLPERYCIGEALLSVRHFVNKFSRCIGMAPIDGAASGAFTRVTLKPFSIGGSRFDGTNMTASYISGTLCDVFSSCYALSRGSVYYMVRPDGVGLSMVSLNNSRGAFSAPPFAASTQVAGSTYNPVSSAVSLPTSNVGSGTITVHIPQWTMGMSRYNRCDNTNGSRTLYDYEPLNLLTFGSAQGGFNNARVKFYKAAGDDYSLGGFVGVPCIYVYGDSVTPLGPDWYA